MSDIAEALKEKYRVILLPLIDANLKDYSQAMDAVIDTLAIEALASQPPPAEGGSSQGKLDNSTIKQNSIVQFLTDAAEYFDHRAADTREDREHWAMIANARNCREAVEFIRTLSSRSQEGREAVIEECSRWLDKRAMFVTADELRRALKAAPTETARDDERPRTEHSAVMREIMGSWYDEHD